MRNVLYGLIILVVLLLTGCADAGEDQQVFSEESVTLDASNSTPDLNGQIVQYEWKQLNSGTTPTVSLSDPMAISPTFTAPDVTTSTEIVFKLKTEEHYACRQNGTTQKCRKNVTYDVVSIFVEPSEDDNDPVVFSIHGIISDFDNTPIVNAQVHIGTQYSTTDANGAYILDAIAPSERIAVNVTHPDYFANSRIVTITDNDVSLDMKLGRADVTHTFSALTGATLSYDRASVALPANGYIDDNGSAYSGDVTAKMSYYPITTRSGRAAFPGSFEGLEGNDVFPIQSFGFMNVELSGSHGQPLNLATGKTATLTFPVDYTLSAPSTIPLWYYDTAKGYWIEEGEATKSGYSYYVGEVSHFTAWNLDVKGPRARFSGCVEDANGTRVEAAKIQFSSLNWDSRIVPSDTNGSIEVYNILAQADLTFSAAKKIGNSWFYGEYPESIRLMEGENRTLSQCIVLQETALPNGTITISGSVVLENWSSGATEPASSGSVYIYTAGEYNRVAQANISSDGSFSVTFQTTDALLYRLSVNIDSYNEEYDYEEYYYGEKTFRLQESKTTYNLGTITATPEWG